MGHSKQIEHQRRIQVLLRSHVERCLQDIWVTRDVLSNQDEEYPFRHGMAMGWVSVVEDPTPGVRVLAHAAYAIRVTSKLLTELNDLNVASRWVKVAHVDDVVEVSAHLHWGAVDRMALEQAIFSVGEVADRAGSLLATVYGGKTPFPAASKTQAPEPSNDEDRS